MSEPVLLNLQIEINGQWYPITAAVPLSKAEKVILDYLEEQEEDDGEPELRS